MAAVIGGGGGGFCGDDDYSLCEFSFALLSYRAAGKSVCILYIIILSFFVFHNSPDRARGGTHTNQGVRESACVLARSTLTTSASSNVRRFLKGRNFLQMGVKDENKRVLVAKVSIRLLGFTNSCRQKPYLS